MSSMIINPFVSSRRVVSLLHMDGSDGSTTFTDEAGKTWTANGNAQIDTAQFKFGGASGLFDGSGDNITATHSDFVLSTTDFTVEGFFRASNIATAYQSIWFQAGHAVYLNGSKLIWYETGDQAASATLLSNTWYHWAVTRQNGLIRVFVDGVKSATDFNTGGSNYTSNMIYMGTNSAGTEPYAGHLDETRLIVGSAIYTSDFTPPASPFTYP